MEILRPQDQEAAIIGILAADRCDDLKLALNLSPEDFYDESLRRLFTAAQTIMAQQKRVTLMSLDEMVTRLYGEEAAGSLMQIAMTAMREHSMQYWRFRELVFCVKDAARRRKAAKVGEALIRAAADEQRDISETLSSAQIALRGCCSSSGNEVSAVDALLETYESAFNQHKPIKTGIGEVDAILCGGLRRGEMTILGARPAVGKSSVLLQIARNAAAQGKRTLFISLEMGAQQIGARILAANSGLNGGKLISGNPLTDDEGAALARGLEAAGLDGTANLSLLVQPGLTIEQLRQEILGRDGVDMVVLDYLQLLRTKQRTGSDFERLGIVSRGLKQIALEADLPVLTAAQVRRQNASGGALRAPGLDELRGSGDLEQDADNVLLLHRIECLDDSTLSSAGYQTRHMGLFEGTQARGVQLLTIEVAKQRQGRTGRAWVIFDPARMRFADPLTRFGGGN